MKFSYKFDAIKRIKEIFEKRIQKEVATIQLEIEKAESEYDDVLKRRMLENKKSVKVITASDLKFHKNYIASLNTELENIRKRIDLLLEQKEQKIIELNEKSKEHKIFEKLEEIHQAEYIQDQNKLEMIGIDEMATSRFISSRNKH